VGALALDDGGLIGAFRGHDGSSRLGPPKAAGSDPLKVLSSRRGREHLVRCNAAASRLREPREASRHRTILPGHAWRRAHAAGPSAPSRKCRIFQAFRSAAKSPVLDARRQSPVKPG
jgi:hypothetical protein